MAGDSTNSVERATINSDGSINNFATVSGITVTINRSGPGIALVGNFVYLISGFYQVGIWVNGVERASLNADGTLTSSVDNTSYLVKNRYASVSAVLGNYYYIIGGQTDTGYLGDVERATFGSDGKLGTFSIVSGVSLANARGNATSVIIPPYIYVIGGYNGTSVLSSVERATINADNTISTFSTVSGVTLATARANHSSPDVNASFIYVIGGTGSTGNYLNTVERAAINSNGTIGNFSIVSGVNLVTARGGHNTVIINNSVYVIGGLTISGGSTQYLNSIEQATLSGGTLSNFSTYTGVTLSSGRTGFTVAMIGDYLFAVAGTDLLNDTNLLDRSQVFNSSDIGNFSAYNGGSTFLGFEGPVGTVVGNYLYEVGGVFCSDVCTYYNSVYRRLLP